MKNIPDPSASFPELIPVPRLRESDLVVVQQILRKAGLLAHVHEPFGEDSVGLFVRAEDLDLAKQVLADFRTRDRSGNLIPIAW